LGTDEADYNADVIMVAAFDKKNGKLNVLSIPRDTMVDVTRSNKKINACYGVGKSDTNKVSDGVAGISKALKTVIGFAPDYYCVIKFEGFQKLVDAIGGVTYNVEQNLVKTDGPPYINIKKGLQKLNGEQALNLVRFRGYPTGDLKRIETAQGFIKATMKQVLTIQNVPKIPELAGIVSQNLSSNLSAGEMIWFATEINKLDKDNDIKFQTVPIAGMGSYNGQSYVYADAEGTVELVNETVNPFVKPITEDNLDIIRESGSKSSSGTSSSSKPKPTKKPDTQATKPPEAQQTKAPDTQQTKQPDTEPSKEPAQEVTPATEESPAGGDKGATAGSDSQQTSGGKTGGQAG
jgi:LCP family protein required for cell wall assembly